MREMFCPHCGSSNTYKSKKFNAWICEDCGGRFELSNMTTEWNSGLQSADFWCMEFFQYAPCSLSHSYSQLMYYVAEGNIGGTLFLIRDVFELMIKIPTVILFDSIYSLLESTNNFEQQFNKEPKLEALYRNSMQMLSTGKWWECVRLGAGLSMEFINTNGLDNHRRSVLSETIAYLKQVYRMFEFKIPGKPKINMVTWRNRAVGHSCLASKPEESYPEIPYILKMFKKISWISLPYYREVCFANGNKDLLIGMNSGINVDHVFIAHKTNEGCHYFRIHDFVAGHKDSMSYFDGYEKGKAYLLDYGDGKRYKASELSRFIMAAKNELDNNMIATNAISSADINENNLETLDIQQLEAQLSEENQVVYIDFIYQWLERQVKLNTSGVFLLQAERGMGKSTFCRTIDQLSQSENVRWYSDVLDGWSEFMENTAIRVWHFNSTYYGRKDIYLKGIKDVLLTLEPGNMENGICSKPNYLVGNLDSIWGNLNECFEDLRKSYFAEALNLTAAEYFRRTNKSKLILVLDGVDEIRDYNELMSYIPSSDDLNSNVYILITCRTNEEIASELKSGFVNKLFSAKLVFKRNEIIESGQTERFSNTNKIYVLAVKCYVDRSIKKLNCEMVVDSATIMEHFDNRFSELAAYFSLCQLNPKFCMLSGTELLQLFLSEIKNNSTSVYYLKVLLILNTLAWCGDSLSLRELAFLSGEGYISYRFLGILNDLRAFIRVIRTERGNCYELSHSEWEESVKKQFPLGSIEFRMRCDKLLDCLEDLYNENRTEDILSDAYEGERWLLTHMLSIYVRDWTELKENWFENIRIQTIYNFLIRFIKNVTSNYDSVINIIPLLDIVRDYRTIEQKLKRDPDVSLDALFDEETSNQFLEYVVNFYTIAKKCCRESKMQRDLIIKAADTYYMMGETNPETEKKTKYYMESLQLYKDLLPLMQDDVNEKLMLIYRIGRSCEFLEKYNAALSYFYNFINVISSYRNAEMITLENKEYLCRTFIRCGNILKKTETDSSDKQLMYYQAAKNVADELVSVSQNIMYLITKSWSETSLAIYYENDRNIENVIYYRQKALETYEMIPEKQKKIEHIEEIRHNYYVLGNLYLQLNQFEKSFRCFEDAMDKDFVLNGKPEKALLDKLINVSCKKCDLIKMDEFKKMKDGFYKEMSQEYKIAFQEVFIIYEHMPESLQKKIPQSFLNLIEEERDRDHQLNLRDGKDFLDGLDDAQLTEETKIVLSLIYRDFLVGNEEKNRLQKKDIKELYSIKMQEVVQATNGILIRISKDLTWDEIKKLSDFSEACNEVWKVLEELPRQVVKNIPLSILMDIKNSRNNKFPYSEKILKIKRTSKRILKFLLSVYVPDFETMIGIYENKTNK